MWNLQYFHFPEILHNDEGIVGEYGFDNIHSYSWGRWRKMAKLHADAATILKIENETHSWNDVIINYEEGPPPYGLSDWYQQILINL